MFCQSWISVANLSSFSDDSREIWKHLPISLIYLSPHCLVVRSPSQLNEDIFRKLLKVGNLSINSWSVLKIEVFIYRWSSTPFPFHNGAMGDTVVMVPIHVLAQPEIHRRKRWEFQSGPRNWHLNTIWGQECYCYTISIPCSTTWNIWGTTRGTPSNYIDLHCTYRVATDWQVLSYLSIWSLHM